MSEYRFFDWDARIYEDPRIGKVQPDDVVDFPNDDPPADGRWSPVLVTEAEKAEVVSNVTNYSQTEVAEDEPVVEPDDESKGEVE